MVETHDAINWVLCCPLLNHTTTSPVRLGTSLGPWWVLVSILVGILVGNVTHRSGSPADMALWGSGCRFWGGGYLPWVPAIYPAQFLILLKYANYTLRCLSQLQWECRAWEWSLNQTRLFVSLLQPPLTLALFLMQFAPALSPSTWAPPLTEGCGLIPFVFGWNWGRIRE